MLVSRLNCNKVACVGDFVSGPSGKYPVEHLLSTVHFRILESIQSIVFIKDSWWKIGK